MVQEKNDFLKGKEYIEEAVKFDQNSEYVKAALRYFLGVQYFRKTETIHKNIKFQEKVTSYEQRGITIALAVEREFKIKKKVTEINSKILLQKAGNLILEANKNTNNDEALEKYNKVLEISVIIIRITKSNKEDEVENALLEKVEGYVIHAKHLEDLTKAKKNDVRLINRENEERLRQLMSLLKLSPKTNAMGNLMMTEKDCLKQMKIKKNELDEVIKLGEERRVIQMIKVNNGKKRLICLICYTLE